MREPAFWWREPGLAARLLTPLGALYGVVAARRMRRPGKAVAVPVICIGNLTAGGAGKTPTAIAAAHLLRDLGANPAFLTRGYGGRLAGPVVVAPTHTAVDVGDEPLLLARVAPTVVARDRVAGAAVAIDMEEADVIIMDDGFQNPSLAKTVSILVVDGRRGFGNGRVIPAGPLRAPVPEQLALAQVLLVIGEPNAEIWSLMDAARTGRCLVLTGRLVPDTAAVAALAGARVLAFAGIADPDKFFTTLRQAGIAVAGTKRFADHHPFGAREAADLVAEAERSGLTLVTTEKDQARMVGDPALAALAARARTLPVTVEIEKASDLRDLLEGVFFL